MSINKVLVGVVLNPTWENNARLVPVICNDYHQATRFVDYMKENRRDVFDAFPISLGDVLTDITYCENFFHVENYSQGFMDRENNLFGFVHRWAGQHAWEYVEVEDGKFSFRFVHFIRDLRNYAQTEHGLVLNLHQGKEIAEVYREDAKEHFAQHVDHFIISFKGLCERDYGN